MKNTKNILYSIFLLVILLCIYIHSYNTVIKKEGFFSDEVFTFHNANCPITTFRETISELFNGTLIEKINGKKEQTVHVLSQDEVKRQFYMPADKDLNLFSVYVSQTLTDSHPPLFYYVIHFASWLTKSPNLKMIGFGVNVFFLICTCIILFFLVSKITLRPALGLIASAYYGFSAEFLNSVVFMRMYCMNAFWITLLAYLYFLFLSTCNENYDKRIVKAICIVQVLSLLTHYFIFVFIFPLVCLTLFRLNNNDLRRKFFLTSAKTFLLFVVLWPQFVIQLAKGFLLKHTTSPIPLYYRIYGYVENVIYSLFGGSYITFFLFIALLIIVLAVSSRNKPLSKDLFLAYLSKPNVAVLASSMFFFLTMCVITPWVTCRYVTPIMPLFSAFIIIGWIYIVKTLFKHTFHQITIVGFITFVISFFFASHIPQLFMYNTEDRKAFKSSYKDCQAFVVGDTKLDILGNFSHPQYVLLDTTQIKEINKYSTNKSVIYINKNIDCKSDNTIKSILSYYKKLDFSTDYFDVYIHKN